MRVTRYQSNDGMLWETEVECARRNLELDFQQKINTVPDAWFGSTNDGVENFIQNNIENLKFIFGPKE